MQTKMDRKKSISTFSSNDTQNGKVIAYLRVSSALKQDVEGHVFVDGRT